jgi:hypothetical protein
VSGANYIGFGIPGTLMLLGSFVLFTGSLVMTVYTARKQHPMLMCLWLMATAATAVPFARMLVLAYWTYQIIHNYVG